MNQTIEQRMQSIEDQLKEIRKGLEESLALYKQSQYPFTNGDISKFRSGAIEKLSKDAEYNEEWHKPHIERWTKERKAALESLIWYKEKYFS